MAYNYSTWLLTANEELVKKLIGLADNRGQASQTFELAEQARAFRYQISELLANLARNRPTFAYVRTAVRTWITYEGERYKVNVGVPTGPIGGAKPRAAAFVATTTQSGDLIISEEITPETWTPISVKLAAAKVGDTNTITFHHPPEPAGIEFIANALAPEFEVIQATPHLIFRRVSRT